MSARRRREVLEKQRVYQDAYRQAQAARARPSRDDVARMLLHFVITEGRDNRFLNELLEEVSDKLVDQGFDARETERFVEALVERYRNGWDFRMKLHLKRTLLDNKFDASEH